MSANKIPFKYYVIKLGRWGQVTKILYKITTGGWGGKLVQQLLIKEIKEMQTFISEMYIHGVPKKVGLANAEVFALTRS